MKERLNRFFNDHEVGIAITCVVTGTIAAATGLYLLMDEHGHRVDGVFSQDDVPGGATVIVTLKNGTAIPFTKPEK